MLVSKKNRKLNLKLELLAIKGIEIVSKKDLVKCIS